MLFNTSDIHYPSVHEDIAALVGRRFSFRKKLELGGVGSQRFLIAEANAEIAAKVERVNGLPYSNIELRQGGIIVWFKVRMESFALALPWYQLSVFKNSGHLVVYGGKWRVKLLPAHNDKLRLKFISKLLELKHNFQSTDR